MKNKCLFLVSLLAITISCQHTISKKKLVIYSPHGKELLGEFEKLYETDHPDVDIQWLDMGSQEVFDRISTESQNPQADLWWGAPATMFMRAEKMDLLEKYKPTWSGQVPASAKSKNDFWFGTFSTPEVIAFNDSSLTNEKAPKDWNEIVDKKWKGKVVMRNPMASGTLRIIFSSMLASSVAETGNEERGWEWLRKLDANTSLYAADPTQMYGKLGGKKEAVTLWNMPDIVLQKQKNGLPFGYNIPMNGTVVLTDGIAIVKGSKNKKLAEDFYEYVTSVNSLLIQAEKYYRIPSRTDIPSDKLPVWLKSLNFKTMSLDWNLIAKKESEWMKKWDAEIKSKKE